jgi:hypothetical protein
VLLREVTVVTRGEAGMGRIGIIVVVVVAYRNRRISLRQP